MTNINNKTETDEAHKLFLTIGKESAPEEIDEVKTAFAGDFEIEVNNSLVRLSTDQLPFVVDIAIGVTGAAIYDFLKTGIKKLLSNTKIKRDKTIIVRKSNEQYIFSDKRVCIRKNAEDIEFDSVDDLFNYLQK